MLSRNGAGPRKRAVITGKLWKLRPREYHIDLAAPVNTLPKEKLDVILYGTSGREITVHYHDRDGRRATSHPFEGVIHNLHRRYNDTSSEYMREKISEFMSERICPTCNGARLRTEALAITVDNVNIVQVTKWPVLHTLSWVDGLSGSDTPLTARQQAIAERILKEIHSRLGFLVDVGLDYLTLERALLPPSPAAKHSASAWQRKSARG